MFQPTVETSCFYSLSLAFRAAYKLNIWDCVRACEFLFSDGAPEYLDALRRWLLDDPTESLASLQRLGMATFGHGDYVGKNIGDMAACLKPDLTAEWAALLPLLGPGTERFLTSSQLGLDGEPNSSVAYRRLDLVTKLNLAMFVAIKKVTVVLDGGEKLNLDLDNLMEISGSARASQLCLCKSRILVSSFFSGTVKKHRVVRARAGLAAA